MVLLCGRGGRIGQIKTGSRKRRQGGHAVECGIIGQADVVQIEHLAAGLVVAENGAEVAVFPRGDEGSAFLRPVHGGGEQALTVAPLQGSALEPGSGRGRQAVLGAIEGLVLVIDDQVSGAGRDLGDQPRGDLGIDVPVTGTDILGAPVPCPEGASGEKLDGRAVRLDLEGAGGDGGGEGGFGLHAAMFGGMAGLL
ncbi:hypothetical protein D9M70_518580 [compost metagenome]